MYWCKIARTQFEFDEIAKLNYETFVEEIPQHETDPSGTRVDPFHEQNTYLIVLADTAIVGMIALREERPFSLDKKIGPVENFLPDVEKMCEIRLMAVRKAHRNGRVFFLLARALSDYCYERGYGAAVISGTTRQLKLYGQIGFRAFAEPVGQGEAVFIPMVTTRKQYGQSVASRLQTKRKLFHPGPVHLTKELAAPFTEESVSHRSSTFQALYEDVRDRLVELGESFPHLLVGSGTLANEAMIAQLKKEPAKGLILVNGEFGNRLKGQAARWQLDFEVLEAEWGHSFSMEKLGGELEHGEYGWMLMVHGETSTGMLNDLEAVADLCETYKVKLCVDAVSSFGAVSFSLKKVWLATAVSGKAIGTMTGIAVVFSHHEIESDPALPAYLDLGLYENKVPFTLSYPLLKSFKQALEAYPERYSLLSERFEILKSSTQDWPYLTADYPVLLTFKAEDEFEHFPLDAHLSGYELHAKSTYLKDRNLFQVSCIQPEFEQDWQMFMKFQEAYSRYHLT
ncbi:aminotransferase class V-fold PLP-dependent enzyme [Planococcus shenhongbingii]|uniref:aminotransferase class V-fold PLP-dependent enzyme n=1 Tax=Planococcus shenhongbingii TaxID=3058398 RepID=UPI0026265CD1|nr:aminotransferase class V-fold PLP-dependent enzyme [Planococcus sp. N016]WKA59074.1 aminotransferase class V-fold PLP-dependent enzyme [Planococcus sp. N016]